jgi:archaellum component FlaC
MTPQYCKDHCDILEKKATFENELKNNIKAIQDLEDSLKNIEKEISQLTKRVEVVYKIGAFVSFLLLLVINSLPLLKG